MSSPAETDVNAAPAAARTGLEGILEPDDARAYERFVTWSIGAGFRLAVVEVTAPRDREALLSWTASKVSGVQVVRLDDAEQHTVWSLLQEAWQRPGGASLLALTRLEELQERARICAQLNLQRDEQARAFAAPWVVVVHPAAALDLQQHAPDFCDFAVLWLRERAKERREVASALHPADQRLETLDNLPGPLPDERGPLDAAREALLLGKIDEANDLLAEHDLRHPLDRATDPERRLMEAALLTLRGEPDRAFEVLRETLPLCDSSERAPLRTAVLASMGQILYASGDWERALELHQEALEIAAGAGYEHGRAIALGHIARILTRRGHIDQAISLHDERLHILERLGDQRARAITLGDIARILAFRGDVDQALRLHEESLQVFDRIGDRRSRAATLGDIARILAGKGDVDQALRLQHERLEALEEMRDRRARAIALLDIAHNLTSKGDIDQALRLYHESLQVFEQLGAQSEVASTLWAIARLEIQMGRGQQAFDRLTRAHALHLKLGHIEGACWVGFDLGRLLCDAGHPDQGLPLLERSRAGFEQLGRPDLAAQVAALIDEVRGPPS